MKKKIIILSIVIVIAVFVAYNSPSSKNEGKCVISFDPSHKVVESEERVVFYSGIDNCDAMTLLKVYNTPDTENFGGGLGEFVESINGLSPAEGEFWSLYVNGEQAQVGASAYITHDGDLIEWKLEAIESY